jgi:hypothetical protein
MVAECKFRRRHHSACSFVAISGQELSALRGWCRWSRRFVNRRSRRWLFAFGLASGRLLGGYILGRPQTPSRGRLMPADAPADISDHVVRLMERRIGVIQEFAFLPGLHVRPGVLT